MWKLPSEGRHFQCHRILQEAEEMIGSRKVSRGCVFNEDVKNWEDLGEWNGHREISQENMGEYACEKEDVHKHGLAYLRQSFMGGGRPCWIERRKHQSRTLGMILTACTRKGGPKFCVCLCVRNIYIFLREHTEGRRVWCLISTQ